MMMDPMELPIIINNELDKRIGREFLMYDAYNNKLVDFADCGNILRNLGCVPTQEEIANIARASEFEPGRGENMMHAGLFIPHVADLIYQKRMVPATAEELLEMFEILDENNRRYFLKEELANLLMEFEEHFTQKEVDDMMTVAFDKSSNTIPYEFYINQLAFVTQDSIFALADKIEADRIAAIPQTKKIGDILKGF